MKILLKLTLICNIKYSTENEVIDTESMFIVTNSCIVIENPNRKNKENIINNINKEKNKLIIKTKRKKNSQ